MALTITANNQSKAYGAALPDADGQLRGLRQRRHVVQPDHAPTVTTTATAASHVSGNPYSITASGAADSDYTIGYVARLLTVNPVALTITANNQTKAYGAALPDADRQLRRLRQWRHVDEPDHSCPRVTTTATAASHVSGNPYSITASGAVDSDYTIGYVAGSLTVNPVALTITADNQSQAYGAGAYLA